ncbi:MAG: CBS domain-containing protein [Saprospiraceae bacterium]
MLDEQVRRIMAPDPLTVNSTDNLAEVSEMMVNQQLQQVPVVDNGKFLGIVTSYDIWQASKNKGEDSNRLVNDVMNTNVIKISPKDKMGTAAELFMDKRFKTLPVVNLHNELKGVITAFDVIKYVFKNEYPHPSIYNSILNEPAAR